MALTPKTRASGCTTPRGVIYFELLIHSVCHSEGVERPKNLNETNGRDSSLSLRMTNAETFRNSK